MVEESQTGRWLAVLVQGRLMGRGKGSLSAALKMKGDRWDLGKGQRLGTDWLV